MSLAEKMIAMFQVTEIQPLLAEVLDKIEDIPPIAMSKLLDKTASAEHFFKVTRLHNFQTANIPADSSYKCET